MNRILNFTRRTYSINFIPEIDGLRFLAVLTVVLFHINTAISNEIGIGLNSSFNEMGGANNYFSLAWWWVRFDLGVKVFFAISGFVLALPFLKYYLGLTDVKVELGPFWVRRLTRLEPPYIITLIGFYLVHVFLLEENATEYLIHLGAGLIYGHVFILGEGNPINPVTWSLETEAQFYLIIPLIMWLVFRSKNSMVSFLILFILVLFSICFRNEFSSSPHLGRSIFSYFVNFSMGIFVCWLFLIYPSLFESRSTFFDVIGLIATVGLFYFYKPQHEVLNQIFFNISIIFVMITAFNGRIINWLYTRPLIYTIGGMCYSIYLLHYAFLHLSVKFTKFLIMDSLSCTSNLVLQIVVNLLLVLIISGLFFIVVEKPTMDKNWPRKLLGFLKKRSQSS